mmetsp:Transcript_65004/g.211864  ORF Transcript_65004/g.211864 Transcript_65004/m.211864 type:complete len:248 (+) Transcript_65004:929-1672(+)
MQCIWRALLTSSCVSAARSHSKARNFSAPRSSVASFWSSARTRLAESCRPWWACSSSSRRRCSSAMRPSPSAMRSWSIFTSRSCRLLRFVRTASRSECACSWKRLISAVTCSRTSPAAEVCSETALRASSRFFSLSDSTFDRSSAASSSRRARVSSRRRVRRSCDSASRCVSRSSPSTWMSRSEASACSLPSCCCAAVCTLKASRKRSNSSLNRLDSLDTSSKRRPWSSSSSTLRWAERSSAVTCSC